MTAHYLTEAVYRKRIAQLSERDLAVVRRVASLRFVSGLQLTRLCFFDSHDEAVNARTARRALLRLTRLDLLDRLPRSVGGVRAGSAGFVYHLGLAGQHLCIERGWQPERRRRRSLTPGTLFVRHALEVSELHTQLVEADRSRRIELLELSAEPLCHRIYNGYGTQRSILKPDSFVRLGLGSYDYSYFIEVDRGTEGTQTLVRQLAIYIGYANSGVEQQAQGVFPLVLWLAPNSERVAVIEDSIRRIAKADRELFRVAQFGEVIAIMSEASA